MIRRQHVQGLRLFDVPFDFGFAAFDLEIVAGKGFRPHNSYPLHQELSAGSVKGVVAAEIAKFNTLLSMTRNAVRDLVEIRTLLVDASKISTCINCGGK